MKKGMKLTGALLIGGIVGSAAGVSVIGTKLNKKAQMYHTCAQKHLFIMQMYDQWLIDKQEGKSLTKFFEDNGYKSIAVYGMSYLGARLLDELKDSGIEVRYAIDKNADNIHAGIEVKSLEDDLPEVDAVIVTAVYFFDEIEKQLAQLVDYPVISLEDVLYGV